MIPSLVNGFPHAIDKGKCVNVELSVGLQELKKGIYSYAWSHSLARIIHFGFTKIIIVLFFLGNSISLVVTIGNKMIFNRISKKVSYTI